MIVAPVKTGLKKAVAVASIIAGICIASADAETVQLVREHGIYMVPVQINRQMTVPFALDSGASEVTIPQDIFLTLTRTGTIKDSDFVGTGLYVMADGSEHSSKRFILRELKVGDHVISNVTANVVSVKADPLLGQSFLSRLPSWAIDNQQHALILRDEGGVAVSPPAASLTQPPAVAPHAGSLNPINDRLLSQPPAEQAKIIAKNVGQGCVGAAAFPMGVVNTAKWKGIAYWSVRCQDGRSFAIQIAAGTRQGVLHKVLNAPRIPESPLPDFAMPVPPCVRSRWYPPDCGPRAPDARAREVGPFYFHAPTMI